jgi:hypothetical protein
MKRVRKRNSKNKKNNFNLFDEKEISYWGNLWKDMPEFTMGNLTAVKSLIVHFKNEEDIQIFSKLINQNIYKSTKSIWFPKVEITRYINKRYIDES